jgi:hypothetical protein
VGYGSPLYWPVVYTFIVIARTLKLLVVLKQTQTRHAGGWYTSYDIYPLYFETDDQLVSVGVYFIHVRARVYRVFSSVVPTAGIIYPIAIYP